MGVKKYIRLPFNEFVRLIFATDSPLCSCRVEGNVMYVRVRGGEAKALLYFQAALLEDDKAKMDTHDSCVHQEQIT